MAFCCLQPKTGVTLVGILNLTLGILLLIDYLLGFLKFEYKNELLSFSEDNSTLSTTTTTTVKPFISDENEECNWWCQLVNILDPIIFYTGFGLMLVLLVTSGICTILSLFDGKSKLSYAKAAWISSGGLIGVTFIVFVTMFILGYHWINLLLILLWHFAIQIYFCIVLREHCQTVEFQRVPVSA